MVTSDSPDTIQTDNRIRTDTCNPTDREGLFRFLRIVTLAHILLVEAASGGTVAAEHPHIRWTDRVMHHYPLVCRIAGSIHTRLPRSVEVGDLINVGVLALIDSLDRFDPSRGVPFEMFARHRIRGAILDALRGEDWVPHSVRRKAHIVDRARKALRSIHGRAPTQQELAERLGVELAEWHSLHAGADIRRLLSLDAPITHDNAAPLVEQVPSAVDVAEEVEGSELRALMWATVAQLPPREATALTLHYLHDLPLRVVGERLGVTESRACQLCSQGVKRLRKKIGRATG